MRLTAEIGWTFGLTGPCQFGFVSLNDLASATQRADIATGNQAKANAVAKMPSRFHAASEHPLKPARRDAFLAATKQMYRLKPEPQGKVVSSKIVPIRTVNCFRQSLA